MQLSSREATGCALSKKKGAMDRTGQSNTDGKAVAYPKDLEAENARLEREVARLEAGTNNLELPPDFGKGGPDVDVEGMFGAMAVGRLKAENKELRAQLAEAEAKVEKMWEIGMAMLSCIKGYRSERVDKFRTAIEEALK